MSGVFSSIIYNVVAPEDMASLEGVNDVGHFWNLVANVSACEYP